MLPSQMSYGSIGLKDMNPRYRLRIPVWTPMSILNMDLLSISLTVAHVDPEAHGHTETRQGHDFGYFGGPGSL